jgi:hypothetical protein
MPTKLESLLDEDNKGMMNAGVKTLSKMLRGFWRDIGLNHAQIALLIQHWLDDPNNQYEDDLTKVNNARGNIRKDLEKDDMTWRIFIRNLRILRPVEIRFLVRIKFRNDRTFRQVAVMRPPEVKFDKEAMKAVELDDLFDLDDPNDYDDEGYHKSESDFNKSVSKSK